MDTQSPPVLSPKKDFGHGVLLVAIQVARTARTSSLALLHEHPYALLFLLVFGVFLLPMSTTAIAGTLFVILTAVATILISIVVFAPSLALLAIAALFTWIFTILALCAYRYMWAPDNYQETLSKHRSQRWSVFKSTLGDCRVPIEVVHTRVSSVPSSPTPDRSATHEPLSGSDLEAEPQITLNEQPVEPVALEEPRKHSSLDVDEDLEFLPRAAY